jgi:hypothetical protein
MRMDFGGGFAYKGSTAQPGKSSEGEQNGQENLEEVKEDSADQTAGGSCGVGEKISASCNGGSAGEQLALKTITFCPQQGGPLPQWQRPILVCGAIGRLQTAGFLAFRCWSV